MVDIFDGPPTFQATNSHRGSKNLHRVVCSCEKCDKVEVVQRMLHRALDSGYTYIHAEFLESPCSECEKEVCVDNTLTYREERFCSKKCREEHISAMEVIEACNQVNEETAKR